MRKYYIIYTLLIIAYWCAMIITMSPKESKSITLPKTEEVVMTVNVPMPKATMPEMDLGDEIFQEAKEPEWGFDFDYIARVVAAESRGEPFEGQVAVARCIWNSAEAKMTTMEHIVEMPNRYADPVSADLVTDSVREACTYAFLGIELPTEENIEYFYSTKNGFYSKWHEENLEYVMTIGNHKFFKEKADETLG